MTTFDTKMLDLAKYDAARLDAERPYDQAGYEAIKSREPKRPAVDCGTDDEKKEAQAQYARRRQDWWNEVNAFLRAESERQKSRTLLYAIRAHGRGRVHMQTTKRCFHRYGLEPKAEFTFDDQAKWIGDRWRAFERVAPTEVAA